MWSVISQKINLSGLWVDTMADVASRQRSGKFRNSRTKIDKLSDESPPQQPPKVSPTRDIKMHFCYLAAGV